MAATAHLTIIAHTLAFVVGVFANGTANAGTGPSRGEGCLVADPTLTPLNVRKSPNGPILGAINNGTLVVVMERRGDWVRIVPHEAAGKSGWVWLEYLICQNGVGRGANGGKVVICSGKLWNINEDYIEIGHGIYQCSVKNVASEAGKKILSVCNLGKRCTIRVEIVPKTADEMADQDNVVITDKDKVLSVRRGAADDTGYAGSRTR
jgi:Bacterial SH3 domain